LIGLRAHVTSIVESPCKFAETKFNCLSGKTEHSPSWLANISGVSLPPDEMRIELNGELEVLRTLSSGILRGLGTDLR
jgi:hypothetical protein